MGEFVVRVGPAKSPIIVLASREALDSVHRSFFMYTKSLLSIVSMALASGLSAQTLLFSEDFGTLANGTAISTANTALTYVRVSTGGGSSITALNPSTAGAGSSGVIVSTSGSLSGIGVVSGGLASFNSGTFGFGLTVPATQGTFFFGIGTGTTTFTNNTTFVGTDLLAGFQITAAGQLQVRSTNTVWTNVGSTTFTAGTVSVSIVFNNSGASIDYAGGSVANTRADVFVNGVLVGDDVTINAAQASASGFRLYATGAAGAGGYEVDNISVISGIAPIPEPSSIALGLAGLAGLVALRRRK